MRERECQSATGGLNDKRLLDASEVCYYLSLGRNRGVEFAKSIGAERKIGRRCTYDRVVIDRYLDEQTGV
ncbi:polyprenyl synthetase solanesyl diphosphate synthase [Lacrimispora sp.]|uniref:polyprenyl synthetase solanesyl diphosphate synthase n=1 Tax=Lacrimispora sp. TaxID=2719234 RepID=UPI00289E549C|nr:polyprenyl synthetase solanesyl diphosphate synthase [Lacrimispora sp.]